MSALLFSRIQPIVLLFGAVLLGACGDNTPKNITVSKMGSGTGTVTSSPAGIACGGTCTAAFAGGSRVTLTAIPASGSSFVGWSGGCNGLLTETTIVANNSACTATFDLTTPPVPTSGYPWKVWTADIPAVPVSSTGLTYYVDGTNGSDNNTGTSLAAAFKSLAKAVSSVAAGDTVLIRKGLYREGIVLINSASGTAGKPITFGSYGDGEVIVDGSSKVTGWSRVSGNVWSAPVSFTPIGVVVGGVPLRQVTQGQNGSTAPQVGVSGVTNGSGKWYLGSGTITADMGSTLGTGDPNNADIVVPNNDGAQYHVYFYQKNYLHFRGLTVRGSGSSGIWGYGSHITVEDCKIEFNGKGAVSFQPDGSAAENSDNAVLTTRAYHNILLNYPRGNNGYAESGGGWAGAIGWSGNLRPVARGNLVYMNGGEGIITYGTTAGRPSGSALFEQNVAFDNWSVNMYFDNQPNNVARNNFLYNHPVDYNLATTHLLYVGNSYPYNALGKFSVCLMLADEQNSSDATGGYANLANSQVYNNIRAGCRVGIRDYSEGADSIRNHGLKNTLIVNNTIIMPFEPVPNSSIFGIFLQDNTTPSGLNRNTNSKIQNNIILGYNNDSLIFSERNGALGGIMLNHNLYFSPSAKPFGSGFSSVTSYDLAGWRNNTLAEQNSLFADPMLTDVADFRGATPNLYGYANAEPKTGSPALGAGTVQTFLPALNFGLVTRGAWNIGAF